MRREDVFVSPQWLFERLGQPDIIPVDGSWYLPTIERDPKAEFAQGHIEGAVFFDLDGVSDPSSDLPHMMPGPVAFSSSMRKLGLGDGQTLVIYDGAGLFSAPRVWWMFKAMGFGAVYILDGGRPAWENAGYPLNDDPVQRTPRHFTARVDASVIADCGDVKAAINGATTIIDARPAPRFEGAVPEPRPGLKAGHMPGARNIAFTDVIEAGRMKSVDALRALFDERGIDRSAPIITSCGSGVSAVTLSLALGLVGAKDVRVYDGSWAEWGARDDAPVETGPSGT